MSKCLAISLLSALSFSLAVPVQAQIGWGETWHQINKQQNRQLREKYGESSSSSGRTYPGEYRFECERRLGYWEWEKISEKYPFGSQEDKYCNAMKESIIRSCRHLPNP